MHGAGNDFVVLTEPPDALEPTPGQIRRICNRQVGIGADGLILLSLVPDSPSVRMRFYNCDGSRAGLCGNGLRCAASFAYHQKMVKQKFISFETDSGPLEAEIISQRDVRISLPLTQDFVSYDNVAGFHGFRGVVGVPHFVVPLSEDLNSFDVTSAGKILRNAPEFAPDGVNVDFVKFNGDSDVPIPIRTYERGVEGETLACGTGVTSSAYSLWKFCGALEKLTFLCRSNDRITVEIIANGNIVTKLYLTGPAVTAYHGMAEDLF